MIYYGAGLLEITTGNKVAFVMTAHSTIFIVIAMKNESLSRTCFGMYRSHRWCLFIEIVTPDTRLGSQ